MRWRIVLKPNQKTEVISGYRASLRGDTLTIWTSPQGKPERTRAFSVNEIESWVREA